MPMPMNDDHGDQFPGAVPAPVSTAGRRTEADQRLVRMNAAYTEKVNAAVQAGREGLAYELAEHTYVDEVSGLPSGRCTSTRTPVA